MRNRIRHDLWEISDKMSKNYYLNMFPCEKIIKDNIVIRVCNPHEFIQVLKVHKACFPNENDKTFRKIFKAFPRQLFVIQYKEEIIGYSLYRMKRSIIPHKNMALLFYIGVLEEFRGQGMGRLLLKTNIEYFREIGVNHMILYIHPENKIAYKLYQNLGFSHTADIKHFYGLGKTAIKMKVDIK